MLLKHVPILKKWVLYIGKAMPFIYELDSFNLKKSLILFIKRIPRGKAKAPKTARPEGNQSPEDLRNRIPGLKEKLAGLTKLHPNANFKHPFFGSLNLKTTIRFLFVHNQHHLKIVQDILAQKQ